MAIVVKDRVQQTSTTTGTSDFVLTGAVTGFQSFAAIGNTNTTYYAAVDPATGDWEVGTGTYSTTGPTLTRTTVYESSTGGSKISFGAGAKNVFCVYPAERAIYEEPSGNTLIDGGPLTVIGAGVPSYTSFSAVLAELYGNVDTFAQVYAQNYNDGADASADMIVYRDNTVVDTANFMDMGINSSNFSSATYPIFTPSSMYLYGDGGEMFVGSGTDDLIFFTGGVDVADEAARFDKTSKALTTVGNVNVGGALDVTGAATFGSTVLLDADPTLALQAATKQYVDTAVSTGLHVHTPVLVATTGNLTATYINGSSGVGATLTNSGAQAALAIDGVNMATNDRVLVWQQSAQAQNGVYVVTTVGSGATNWVLTRSSDADTYSPADTGGLGGGDYFYVQSGSTGAGDSYICTNDGTITFGTTAITFSQFSGAITYVGGTNIDITGQTISLTGTVAPTNGGTGVNTVTTGDLLYGSASNTWSKLAAGGGYKSLVMNAGGTNVEWNAVALNQSGAVSGSLGATNGGTGLNSYATGDLIYSSAANTLAKLSGNITTTKKFLNQTGTGSDSAAPSWDTVSASDISGLGTMASQNANNVAITGGTVTGVAISGASTINASVIGGSTPAAITGTTVTGTTVSGTVAVVAANGVMAIAATVTADVVVPTGCNVISVSPWSVASGVSFTLPSGSRQVIL
jgi:hypothetical protein